jgi:hypothetical protein
MSKIAMSEMRTNAYAYDIVVLTAYFIYVN